MPRRMGRKNVRAIKFLTTRPNGILRGGLGLQNGGRPLKSLEEHFRMFPQNDKHAALHFINNFCYIVITCSEFTSRVNFQTRGFYKRFAKVRKKTIGFFNSAFRVYYNLHNQGTAAMIFFDHPPSVALFIAPEVGAGLGPRYRPFCPDSFKRCYMTLRWAAPASAFLALH